MDRIDQSYSLHPSLHRPSPSPVRHNAFAKRRACRSLARVPYRLIGLSPSLSILVLNSEHFRSCCACAGWRGSAAALSGALRRWLLRQESGARRTCRRVALLIPRLRLPPQRSLSRPPGLPSALSSRRGSPGRWRRRPRKVLGLRRQRARARSRRRGKVLRRSLVPKCEMPSCSGKRIAIVMRR